MICITAIYANTRGSRFDGRYYAERHRPMAESLLGQHGLHALRISLGVEGLDASPPPFWAISEMIFPSRAAFDAAMGACGDALFADAPNYTDVTPILQLSSWAEDSNGDSRHA